MLLAKAAALLQVRGPIAFESKKLNSAQRNYSAYERELYANVHALKQWHHYLYGAQFVVFDQESIKWFTTQKDLKGRKARWAEFLQDFDCTLRYHKGRYNVVADALSCMPEVESLSFTESRSDLLASIQGKCEHDQAYGLVWKMVTKRDPSPKPSADDAMSTQDSPLSSDELNRWKHFTIDQGYLLHKGRVCVPQDADIWRQILYECHDSPSAGHPGIRKTNAHVRRHFYWAGMHKDVHGYVTHCQKCQVR